MELPFDLTYGRFLLIFVIFPTIFFAACILRNSGFEANIYRFLWVGVIALIAFIWTPIWDNYLVANGVWWYDTKLVWNIIIGVVPLEEYLFFVLQPIFVGVYLIAMTDLTISDQRPKRMKFNLGVNVVSVIMIGALWSFSAAFFALFYGNPEYEHWTYLALIVVWSFPPVMLQAFWGMDILLHYRRLLGFVIISATVYLSAADCIAIGIAGIWTIAESKSIGNVVPNILPFEEAFFFLITNGMYNIYFLSIPFPLSVCVHLLFVCLLSIKQVLCVFGCSFYLLPESRLRMQHTLECLFSKKRKKTA